MVQMDKSDKENEQELMLRRMMFVKRSAVLKTEDEGADQNTTPAQIQTAARKSSFYNTSYYNNFSQSQRGSKKESKSFVE